MNVISKATLRAFWHRHPQARGPLEAWFADVRHADWDGPADVKADFGSTADFVGDNRVIFDIAGNKYRLIVHIAYRFQTCAGEVRGHTRRI
jgi:mRNA interferase HigB